jgi:hypothetical protein
LCVMPFSVSSQTNKLYPSPTYPCLNISM